MRRVSRVQSPHALIKYLCVPGFVYVTVGCLWMWFSIFVNAPIQELFLMLQIEWIDFVTRYVRRILARFVMSSYYDSLVWHCSSVLHFHQIPTNFIKQLQKSFGYAKNSNCIAHYTPFLFNLWFSWFNALLTYITYITCKYYLHIFFYEIVNPVS